MPSIAKSGKLILFPNGKFSLPEESDSLETTSYQKESLGIKKTSQTYPKQPVITEELLDDLKSLSKTALRNKYRREESSHRNRKAACKKSGAVFSQEFCDFGDFLSIVGVIPGPGKGWSLDRIDNENPDYFPGGVRWADPQTQNRNKSDTILLTHNGVTRPLTEWAEIVGIKPDTMRKRRQNGWSDTEVIFGRWKPKKLTPTSARWEKLVPGRKADSYTRLEKAYLNSRQPVSDCGPYEERERWLAAIANQHIDQLREQLSDLQYEGKIDNYLNFQYEFWESIRVTLRQDFPQIFRTLDHRRRMVGRISWQPPDDESSIRHFALDCNGPGSLTETEA